MDRLNRHARRKAERDLERKTFGPDTGALAEALRLALQPRDTEPKDNPARVCRLKWRTPSGHVNLAAKRR